MISRLKEENIVSQSMIIEEILSNIKVGDLIIDIITPTNKLLDSYLGYDRSKTTIEKVIEEKTFVSTRTIVDIHYDYVNDDKEMKLPSAIVLDSSVTHGSKGNKWYYDPGKEYVMSSKSIDLWFRASTEERLMNRISSKWKIREQEYYSVKGKGYRKTYSGWKEIRE